MRQRTFWTSALAAAIAVTIAFGFAACNEEPEQSKTEEPDTPTGKLSEATFHLDTNTATAEHPAVVTADSPANLSMSLTSTYTDPDGSTFAADVKATVQLTTQDTTVSAASIDDLLRISQKIGEDTSTTQGETTTVTTPQTFTIGGQTITFALSREMILHKNSRGETVTMPYLRLDAAKAGDPATTPDGEPYITVPDDTPRMAASVRLRPLPQTRGTYTTGQAYDVSVLFTVEAHTVYAPTDDHRTLTFQVDYTAVVENTHEYPDPQTTFAYHITPTAGTASAGYPYTMTQGAEQMTLDVEQQVAYSWFDLQALEQRTVNYTPSASITLTIEKDTAFVDGIKKLQGPDALPATTASTGENPITNRGEKEFTFGGEQTIRINWNFSAYHPMDTDGNFIALPYVAIGEPELVSVNMKRKEEDHPYGVNASIYEMTVRFKQEVYTQNAAENTRKTIEYLVKYIAVEQIKLVKVTYRKGWKWEPAHDNIIFGYYACVYRDRTYSNGETVTDTYWDYGHFRHMSPVAEANGGTREYEWDGKKITYSAENRYRNDSTISIAWRSISVPDLSKLIIRGITVSRYVNEPPGTWPVYKVSRLGNPAKIPLDNVEICGADSISDLPSGFYFWGPEYYASSVVLYKENDKYYPPPSNYLFQPSVVLRMPDQFMVIDGQMITFLEFRGDPVVTSKEEDITMPNGAPGKVFTLEGRQHFLGKDFYVAAIDTVYQQSPTPYAATDTPATTTRDIAALIRGYAATAADASTRNLAARQESPQMPAPYLQTPCVVYGKSPNGTTRPHQPAPLFFRPRHDYRECTIGLVHEYYN
ncbi:MAG: hypothetical protein J6W75_00045 [Bacteroidaceae bacterium]|nr:hypothetical protein [Bacteroidaceae bacterium]